MENTEQDALKVVETFKKIVIVVHIADHARPSNIQIEVAKTVKLESGEPFSGMIVNASALEELIYRQGVNHKFYVDGGKSYSVRVNPNDYSFTANRY